MLANASARSFSQGLPFLEATRLDWDLFKFSSSAAGFAAGSNIDAIVPGRGTWHVQLQVAYLTGTPGESTVVLMRAPGNAGFVHDIAAPGSDTGERMMESIIALGSSEEVVLHNTVIIPAGPTLSWLFSAKRITR